MHGTIKWFENKYGFILPDDGGEDVFVHRSSVTHLNERQLAKGASVEYQTKPSLKGGLEAINIKSKERA